MEFNLAGGSFQPPWPAGGEPPGWGEPLGWGVQLSAMLLQNQRQVYGNSWYYLLFSVNLKLLLKSINFFFFFFEADTAQFPRRRHLALSISTSCFKDRDGQVGQELSGRDLVC